MLLFCDSFDHYTTLSQKWDLVTGSPTISGTGARNGSGGVTLAAGCRLQKNIGTAVSGVLGFALNYHSAGSFDENICAFVDASLPEQIGVGVTSAGKIIVSRGSSGAAPSQGTVLGTSTLSMSFGVWHYIEVKVLISATVGTVEVRVDGVVFLALTGQNTKSTSNTSFSAIHIGTAVASGPTYYIDDVYFCDLTGSQNNDFLGDTRVQAVLPTANGTTNNFTRGGTNTGANWSQVNENPPDDDTTYNTDGTVNDIDRYTYPAISSVTGVIRGVAINMRARKDDAGTRSIRGAVKSSSTTGDTGADIPMSSGYASVQGILELDPATSAAWTVSGVNAAEFGVKVTA